MTGAVRRAALAAIALAPFTVGGCPPGAPMDFGPYLQWVTSDSIVVSWRTVTPSAGTVEYGFSSSYGQTATDGVTAEQHHVVLKNLVPSKKYHYRVVIGATKGKDYTFYTAPAGQQDFRFIAMAEIHREKQIADFDPVIKAFDPHFMIDPGDDVDQGDDLEDWAAFFNQGEYNRTVPRFPAPSNHAYAKDHTSITAWTPWTSSIKTYREVYHLPGNERWYAFRYSNTLFLALDSMYRASIDVWKDQPKWLEQTLKAETKGPNPPKFIVAFFHHPPAENDPVTYEWDVMAFLSTQFVSKFKKYGVDLVVVGHNFAYVRSKKDGVNYVQLCSGADPRPLPHPFAVKVETKHRSILKVTVKANEMKFEAVRPDGTVIDSGTILP